MAKELTSQQQEAIEHILLSFKQFAEVMIEATKELALYLKELEEDDGN